MVASAYQATLRPRHYGAHALSHIPNRFLTCARCEADYLVFFNVDVIQCVVPPNRAFAPLCPIFSDRCNGHGIVKKMHSPSLLTLSCGAGDR